MRARALTAAALVALAAGGCGDERTGAAKAANKWFEAVDEGDTKKACDLMLDTGVRSLRAKYVRREGLKCPELVREYRKILPDAMVRQVRDAGLVAHGDIDKDRIGTFPARGEHEFSVILMQRVDGDWKVASVGLGTTPTRRE